MSAARVVSVANAMVDVVARVPHLPQRGGDVLAAGGGPEVGGAGYRALVAAASAGAGTLFAGRIGTGPSGDLVRAALDAAGIAVASDRTVPGQDTGTVLALVEPDGERTFATVPGAEAAPPALEDVVVRPGDHVHVHGYGLVRPERAAAIARWVAALPADAVVLLDPGPFGAGLASAALADRIDWWSGNGAEAAAQTGFDDPATAATALAARTRRGAVVRLGAAGCLLVERGGPPRPLRAPAVAAVDTSGAGDTHVGTFLALLTAGVTADEAAVRANATAAAFVTRPDQAGWSARSRSAR